MIGLVCVCSFLTTVQEFWQDAAMAFVRVCHHHHHFVGTNRTVTVDCLASIALS
jgi:hypothetical protein